MPVRRTVFSGGKVRGVELGEVEKVRSGDGMGSIGREGKYGK